VIALARAGDKLGAIKRYREHTGCDLKVAKDVVDTIE
jgi:ribosomal protein L7/L12